MIFSRYAGSSAREARSCWKAMVSSAVGTLEVRRYQNMASGSISFPSGAVGRTAWHSGMVRPQKRMPSSESRTEGSQSMALMPRMPPAT